MFLLFGITVKNRKALESTLFVKKYHVTFDKCVIVSFMSVFHLFNSHAEVTRKKDKKNHTPI